jgi:cysteine-rich repeat protein
MKLPRRQIRVHGAVRRRAVRFASALAIASIATTAAPPAAQATFHLAHIQRVMTGLDGSTNFQFVEIQMEQAGQNLTDGSRLIAFNADGSFSHVVLELDKNVLSGANRSFLMASAAFEAETGLAPDFVFSTASGNALPAESGMVCWGKPDDQTDPNDGDMVDCVSYGNYTGPDNDHTDAPSPITPFGHGLNRIGDSNSSADDFECEDPAVPTTNAPDKVGVPASTPCGGGQECGNGTVEDPETCDDGDTDFTPGDFCSADCDDFACGVPTSSTATVPKTSDALFVLRAAVGSVSCSFEVCDVNDSQSINTTDALAVLRRAVGQNVILDCPTFL